MPFFFGQGDYSTAADSFLKLFNVREFWNILGLKYLQLMLNSDEYSMTKLIILAMIKISNDSIPNVRRILKECEKKYEC